MRFVSFHLDGRRGLAVMHGEEARGLFSDEPAFPGELPALIAQGADTVAAAADRLSRGGVMALERADYLPPVGQTGKLICLGINYSDHASETGHDVPAHPTVFVRFPSSLIGHRADLIRPRLSTQFDYEGELVAVIGRGGRHIPANQALDHVAGYSIFNDASVRDYQFQSTQWTVGKNFDGTGSLGPVFVTADELPPGGAGLRIETRLNGDVVQRAGTSDMIYDVAQTIAFLSQAFTLDPADVLIMGTPPGVGFARTPPLFLRPGDTVEVEIEGIGVLSNGIADEVAVRT